MGLTTQSKPSIERVSKPVSGLTLNAGTVETIQGQGSNSSSQANRKDQTETEGQDQSSEQTNNPSRLFRETSSQLTAKKATTPFYGPANKQQPYFGSSLNPALASNAALASLGDPSQRNGALENLGWGNQGGTIPGTYGGGDPNSAPGLSGYYFGELKPIQHAKPTGAAVSDTMWNLINNHLGRAFANGDDLNKAIKPYMEMDIPSAFKENAFALSTLAMYKPSEELINSGKLNFLINDQKSYSNANETFNQALREAGISRDVALQKLQIYGGITSFANLDPRAAVQVVKGIDYLENLPNNVIKLRAQGGGEPSHTLVVDVINKPSVDGNGAQMRNHLGPETPLSALKEYLPQSGRGSASNVIIGAVQGDYSQTRSGDYFTFAGRQMQAAKADYNLVINYASHGSGTSAHMGDGADGSIDTSDYDYFRKIGYENATAKSIMINFNSCHNGAFSGQVAKWVAEGVRARREEMGSNMAFSDMQIVGRGSTREGWLTMDGKSNSLPYWDQNGKLQTIHGSLVNDMQTHVINIKGNEGQGGVAQKETNPDQPKTVTQAEQTTDKAEEDLKEAIAKKNERMDLETQVA